MKNKKLVLVFALVAVLVASVMICSFIAFAEDNDVTVAKLGDVDGNGTVGAEDVVLLSQYFANYDYDTNTSYTQITTGADLNNDSKVTLADLQMLRVGLANGDFDEPEGCAHEWADATCETPKTCSICGETEGEALGHNTNGTVEHKDATCTENGVVGGTYCDVCNEGKEAAEKVIEAAGHDWGAATCTSAAKCKLCTATTGEALGHDYIVNDEGIHVCSRCDKKRAVRAEISSIGGKAQFVSSQKYSFSVGKTTSTTSGKQGMLYLKGWGALCGEATGIKYRVLTSDGTQVIQEWRDLEAWDSYTLWENNTANLAAQQGIDATITNAYNFIGKIDLSAFPGATVTVEVAFVLKDAPEGSDLLIFAHATNITNKETRPVYFNATFSNSVGALSNGTVMEKTGVSTTAGRGGLLYFYGWGGTIGEIDYDAETSTGGVKYRVVDANGNVLEDWSYLDQYTTYPICTANTANLATVQGTIPAATHAYTVRGWVDLTDYVGSTVTVEFAYVLKNAPADYELCTFIIAKDVNVVE